MKICFIAGKNDFLRMRELRDQLEREHNGALSFFLHLLQCAVPSGCPIQDREAVIACLCMADLYILPLDAVLCLPPFPLPVPFLAYGPSIRIGEAFKAGCADYLAEPLQKPELEARILRFLKLRIRLLGITLACGQDHVLNRDGVGDAGQEACLMLSDAEFRIFQILALSLNRAVPRSDLSHALWGENPPASRSLDAHIAQLRTKLARLVPGADAVLRCFRGEGYILLGEFCG